MPFPISLDEIERAYAETELRPSATEWFGRGPYGMHADPLVAVHVMRYGREKIKARFAEFVGVTYEERDSGVISFLANEFGLRPSQVRAFSTGFDRPGPFGDAIFVGFTNEDSRDAYDAGLAAYDRFIKPTEG